MSWPSHDPIYPPSKPVTLVSQGTPLIIDPPVPPSQNIQISPQAWFMQPKAQAMSQAVNIYKLHKECAAMQMELHDMQRIREIAYWLGTETIIIPASPVARWYSENLISSLPEDLTLFVDGLSQASGWSFDALLLPTLGTIAAATRGRVKIKMNQSWQELLTLYILEVSNSGAKKSLIIDSLKQPFKDFIQNKGKGLAEKSSEYKRYSRNLAATEKLVARQKIAAIIAAHGSNVNNMIKAIAILSEEHKAFDAAAQVRPYPIRLTAEHVSARKLAQLMEQNGESIFLIGAEDELIQRIIDDRKIDISLYLKGYNGEEYGYETSTAQSVRLDHPVISIIYIVQSNIAYRLYNSLRLQELGLSPRFLPFFVPEIQGETETNREASVTGYEGYAQRINQLLNRYYTQNPEREFFTLHPEQDAYELSKEFEAECRQLISYGGQTEGLRSFLGKLHGTAVRLAGALHCWRYDAPEEHALSCCDMRNAIEMAMSMIDHAQYAFNDTGLRARKIAAKIWDYFWCCDYASFYQNGLFVFTVRDIQRSTWKLTKDDIMLGLRALEQCNIVRCYDRPGVTPLYILHPGFFYNNLPREIR